MPAIAPQWGVPTGVPSTMTLASLKLFAICTLVWAVRSPTPIMAAVLAANEGYGVTGTTSALVTSAVPQRAPALALPPLCRAWSAGAAPRTDPSGRPARPPPAGRSAAGAPCSHSWRQRLPVSHVTSRRSIVCGAMTASPYGLTCWQPSVPVLRFGRRLRSLSRLMLPASIDTRTRLM